MILNDLHQHFDKYITTSSESKTHDDLSIIEECKVLEKYLSNEDTAIFLWNTVTQKFIYMSQGITNLIGYIPDDYLNTNGVQFSYSNFHPDQLVAVKSICEKIQQFYIHKKMPSDKYFISTNMMYKTIEGKYIQLLQRSFVVKTNKEGLPEMILSFGNNISHLKKMNCIDLAICSAEDKNYWTFDFENKQLKKGVANTKQEATILKLSYQGYNAKEIASLLNTTTNTINTHRKNILLKTNCVNTTASVTYCKLVGLID